MCVRLCTVSDRVLLIGKRSTQCYRDRWAARVIKSYGESECLRKSCFEWWCVSICCDIVRKNVITGSKSTSGILCLRKSLSQNSIWKFLTSQNIGWAGHTIAGSSHAAERRNNGEWAVGKNDVWASVLVRAGAGLRGRCECDECRVDTWVLESQNEGFLCLLSCWSGSVNWICFRRDCDGLWFFQR